MVEFSHLHTKHADHYSKTPRENSVPFWVDTPTRTSRRGHFWVTGAHVTHNGQTFQRGPMFVDWKAPERVTQPHPVVLVHGGTLQGTEWLNTPDGRPGWAQRFVEAGYAVFVVRSSRSRSFALPPRHRWFDGTAVLLRAG